MSPRVSLPVVALVVLTALALAGCAHAPRPGTVLTIVGAAATLTGVAVATGGSTCQEQPQPSCDANSSDSKVGWPIAGLGAAVLIAGVVWMATDAGNTSSALRAPGRAPLSDASLDSSFHPGTRPWHSARRIVSERTIETAVPRPSFPLRAGASTGVPGF